MHEWRMNTFSELPIHLSELSQVCDFVYCYEWDQVYGCWTSPRTYGLVCAYLSISLNLNCQSVNKESTSTNIQFCTCVGMNNCMLSESKFLCQDSRDLEHHHQIDEDCILFLLSVTLNNRWVSICGTLKYECTLCLYLKHTASHSSQDGETNSINFANVGEPQIGCAVVNVWSDVMVSFINVCSKPLQQLLVPIVVAIMVPQHNY